MTLTKSIDRRHVGFIGLGRMGAPMVARLLDAGYSVTGVDAAPGAAGELEGRPGFERALELRDVVVDADPVILMLPSSDAVEQILVQDRLLELLEPGALLIDMGSSEPVRTRQMADRIADHGATMMDAPVSGGVAGAQRGTLTIMVGGPAASVEAARPLLSVLGSRVTHVGEIGAGHALKALNNLMSAAHLLITSEALLAGRSFGLDVKLALDVINNSSGRSGSTQTKWPDFVLSNGYNSGFSMQLMVKDMGIAVDLERHLGARAGLGECAVALWRAAAEELPDDADHTEIVKWLEQHGGQTEEPSVR